MCTTHSTFIRSVYTWITTIGETQTPYIDIGVYVSAKLHIYSYRQVCAPNHALVLGVKVTELRESYCVWLVEVIRPSVLKHRDVQIK